MRDQTLVSDYPGKHHNCLTNKDTVTFTSPGRKHVYVYGYVLFGLGKVKKQLAIFF